MLLDIFYIDHIKRRSYKELFIIVDFPYETTLSNFLIFERTFLLGIYFIPPYIFVVFHQ